MAQRATGRIDDWGWFEIKPMPRIVTALAEIGSYYLRLWNGNVLLPQPARRMGAHACQVTTGYVFVAVTPLPGVIGYLTYRLQAVAEAAAATIVTLLAGLFAKRLIAQLSEIELAGELVADALAEFILAWALLLAMLLVIALAVVALIPEAAAITAAESVTILVAQIATLIPGFSPA